MLTNAYLHLPNGHRVLIHLISTITLHKDLTLIDVLYVPDFKFNLLSVSALSRSLNCIVFFFVDHCIIQDHIQGLTIGKGRRT